jgi:hypothetical protein
MILHCFLVLGVAHIETSNQVSTWLVVKGWFMSSLLRSGRIYVEAILLFKNAKVINKSFEHSYVVGTRMLVEITWNKKQAN